MKKKNLSILLIVFLITCFAVPTYADSSEEENVDYVFIETDSENIPDFDAAPIPYISESQLDMASNSLNIETDPDTSVKIVRSAARVLGVATNYEELKAIVENDTLDGAYIFNNIQLEDTLKIDRNFTFAALLDGVTIYAAEEKRHFILAGDGFTVDLGQVVLDGGFTGNIQDVGGGGIEVKTTDAESVITIENGVIQNNYKKRDTSGDTDFTHAGGGICFASYEGQLIVKNCKIQNNTSGGGGGIYAYSSNCELVIVDSILTKNLGTSKAIGGGIYYSPGSAIYCNGKVRMENTEISYHQLGTSTMSFSSESIIKNCDIIENIAVVGAGIYAGASSTVEITDTNILNNTAILFTPFASVACGGAIYAGGADITVSGCEISGNTAEQGGGIYINNSNSNGSLSISNSMISDNTSSKYDGGGIAILGIADYDFNLSMVRFSNNSPQNIYVQ